MDNGASSGIFFSMLIIWFYLKKIWKIKIFPHFPRYFSCFFGFQKLLRLNSDVIVTDNSDVMGKYMPSVWFKMSNSKIPHLKFCRFLTQSLTNIIGKTFIGTIVCFSPYSPFNNFASSNVIGSQHCIGGEGQF